MTVTADTLALNIILEGLLFMVLSIVVSSKNMPKNHTLFKTKNGQIDTLFMTKTAEKPYALGSHIPTYPM